MHPSPLRLAYFSPDAQWQQRRLLQLDRSGVPGVSAEVQDLVRQTTGQDWQDVRIELVPDAEAFMHRRQRPATAQQLPPAWTLEVPSPALPAATAAAPPRQGPPAEPRFSAPIGLRSGPDLQQLALRRSERAEFELRSRVWLSRSPQAQLVASSPALGRLLQSQLADPKLLPGSWLLMRDGEALGPYRIEARDIEFNELVFGLDPQLVPQPAPQRRRHGGDERQQYDATTETLALRAGPRPIEILAALPHSESAELTIECTSSLPPDHGAWRGQPGLQAWHFELSPGDPLQLERDCVLRYPVNRVPRPAPAPPISSR